MATKECPYCHKEIADEAILCKYCHNLLIGGNQDIESAVIAGRERAKNRNAMQASSAVDQALGRKAPSHHGNEEDLTREFSTIDSAELQERTRAFSVPKQPQQPIRQPGPQPKRPEPQQARQPGPQPQRQPGPQPDYYYDDDRFDDTDKPYYGDDEPYYDDDRYYEDDTYPRDDDYQDDDRYYDRDDDYYDQEDDDASKKKRIFIITVLITLSVIAVVALAIFVGYKLVGFAKNDSSSSSAGAKNSSITTATKIGSSSSNKDEETTTTKKSSESSESETTKDTETETSPTETETSPMETETSPTETETSPTETETQPSQTETSQDTQTSSDTQTQQSQTQPSQTQQGGTDQAQVLANVGQAITAYNTSGIKSYEYRSEDANAVYLYIFTNDNHAYSVAYFKDSGQSKIVQAW